MVEVFGAAWMAELTLQKRALIAHIQKVTGHEAVTSLHFVPASVAPAGGESAGQAAPRASITGPRPTARPRKNPKGV